MRYLFLFCIAIFANCSYQFFGGGDYLTAIERSYFQGAALFVVWLWDIMDIGVKS